MNREICSIVADRGGSRGPSFVRDKKGNGTEAV